MKITLRLIVRKEWYETDTTKTGWDSHGWWSDDMDKYISENGEWTIVSHLEFDKYYNPTLGIIEKIVNYGK
jgi:hypothetical protein